MSVEIRRVENKRDLKKFINFPFSLLSKYPNWVPSFYADEMNTLDRKRNAAFDFCEAEYWLAYKDGVLVGRIAGIINRHYIEKWGKKYARFGWIDFIDDFEVAKALLETVENWARSKGMVGIQGPLGFTDMDKEGMLIEGFDELGTMPMIYNPAYYPEYIDRLGYKKDVDWLEFEIHVPDAIPERALRVQKLIQNRTGAHLVDWKNPSYLKKHYAKDVFDIVNQAYSGLYGTTELSERQINAYIAQYLSFVDKRFLPLIADKNGRIIGFGIALPSMSRALQQCRGRILPFGWIPILHALKHPKSIDLYLVGVRPEYKSSGIVAFLMTTIAESCLKAGIKTAESSGELENNEAVQSLWNGFEKRQHKRRRSYIKTL